LFGIISNVSEFASKTYFSLCKVGSSNVNLLITL